MKYLLLLGLLFTQGCFCQSLDSTAQRLHNNRIIITVIDSNFPPVDCNIQVTKAGYIEAIPMWIGLITGIGLAADCALYPNGDIGDPSWCYIVGSTKDPVGLGHELRHCFVGQFHLPMLPFIDIK